jgi:hypothetical protein
LVVEQLAQGLERQALLLQRGHPLQKLVAQDVDGNPVEPGCGEQVDDLPRVHRAANHLPHGQVDVSLEPGAARLRVIG